MLASCSVLHPKHKAIHVPHTTNTFKAGKSAVQLPLTGPDHTSNSWLFIQLSQFHGSMNLGHNAHLCMKTVIGPLRPPYITIAWPGLAPRAIIAMPANITVSSEYMKAGPLRGISTLMAPESVLVGEGNGKPSLLSEYTRLETSKPRPATLPRKATLSGEQQQQQGERE